MVRNAMTSSAFPPRAADPLPGPASVRAGNPLRCLVLLCATVGFLPTYQPRLGACTAFCAKAGDHVLVGNNEDSDNPRTRLWFVPADGSRHGRLYVGYDDLFPQGGMNDRGLWFDGFVAPRVQDGRGQRRPRFSGNLLDEAMATCATVAEVVALFERYDRDFLESAVVMFADASGDAASIERYAVVRKTGPHFVQTNFHQSGATRRGPGDRYRLATTMLGQAGDAISHDLFVDVLAATRQTGPYRTVYSNVYDLTTRRMTLFQPDDPARTVTFNLEEELAKGRRVLEIPALFAADEGQARPAAIEGPLAALTAVLASCAIAAGILALTRS
jgi:hypothetical protein